MWPAFFWLPHPSLLLPCVPGRLFAGWSGSEMAMSRVNELETTARRELTKQAGWGRFEPLGKARRSCRHKRMSKMKIAPQSSLKTKGQKKCSSEFFENKGLIEDRR
jgi:hypothetical protein